MIALVDFHFLVSPVERLDEVLSGLFEGAPLAVALGVAYRTVVMPAMGALGVAFGLWYVGLA